MGDTILTVVGRAKNDEDFLDGFARYAPDNYEVIMVHSLGEFYEADNKERFICFLFENLEEDSVSNISLILHTLRGNGFGVESHEDMDSAIAYAKSNYNFEVDDEKREVKFTEMREKFPFFTAEEWEQFQVFDAMYHTGKIIPIRGRLNDELVMVICSVAQGHDEIRVTPMAVITNDYIQEGLVLPFAEEEE